jgi:hypothetical protein
MLRSHPSKSVSFQDGKNKIRIIHRLPGRKANRATITLNHRNQNAQRIGVLKSV